MFGRMKQRGLEVRRMIQIIGPVRIHDAGRQGVGYRHGRPMIRTVQVSLGKRIRRWFRTFLMFVLMMPRMGGLGSRGLVIAILRHRSEGGLEREKAKQKNE